APAPQDLRAQERHRPERVIGGQNPDTGGATAGFGSGDVDFWPAGINERTSDAECGNPVVLSSITGTHRDSSSNVRLSCHRYAPDVAHLRRTASSPARGRRSSDAARGEDDAHGRAGGETKIHSGCNEHSRNHPYGLESRRAWLRLRLQVLFEPRRLLRELGSDQRQERILKERRVEKRVSAHLIRVRIVFLNP